MPVTSTFDQFTDELRQRLQVAKAMGMSEQDIKKRAQDVGDYLAQHVDPRSPEQRVLKELWQVADQQEQQAIANCVYKMVERQGSRV
ncbi:MAG TPA: DUF3243 domain-containing protein [Bacillota bacterium]